MNLSNKTKGLWIKSFARQKLVQAPTALDTTDDGTYGPCAFAQQTIEAQT